MIENFILSNGTLDINEVKNKIWNLLIEGRCLWDNKDFYDITSSMKLTNEEAKMTGDEYDIFLDIMAKKIKQETDIHNQIMNATIEELNNRCNLKIIKSYKCYPSLNR